jgi:hypothetical protein
MQNLHESTWDHTILYADRSLKDEQLLITSLLQESKNMNVASCSNLKFIFYFMETTHEPLHLLKWSFVHWKIMAISTSLIWIVIFFHGAFKYCGTSKLWGYVGTNIELGRNCMIITVGSIICREKTVSRLSCYAAHYKHVGLDRHAFSADGRGDSGAQADGNCEKMSSFSKHSIPGLARLLLTNSYF